MLLRHGTVCNLFGVLVLTCALAVPALAQQGTGTMSGGKGAVGTISELSDDSITIKKLDGASATFAIASTTIVTLDGAKTEAADLATDEVAIVVSANGTVATAVLARSLPSGTTPSVEKGALGKIHAVSTTSITLMKLDGTTATFTLTASTPVLIDGATASVQHLTDRQFAAVVSADGTSATAVYARTPPAGWPDAVGKGGVGMISAVSSTSVTLKKLDGTTATFTVSASTPVTVDGVRANAKHLTLRQFAAIVSADGTSASRVAAYLVALLWPL